MISANGNKKVDRSGIQLEQDQKRQAILDEMLKLNPNCEFKVNEYTTELIYYSVSVVKGKIVVNKDFRHIYIKDDPIKLVKYGYRTKSEAEKAIEKVFPKALNHFELCKNKFLELEKELNFCIGFNYDGDSYGIYNEYNYISFELDGFSFQFEL